MNIKKILSYPEEKFKKLKPVQRLPIVIFIYVFLYYWLYKGNVDWEKIFTYTFAYWIWITLIIHGIGLKLLDKD